jgi:hypothetical protein
VTDSCLTNPLDDLASTVVPEDSISNVGPTQPPPVATLYPVLPVEYGQTLAYTRDDEEHWDAVIDRRLPLPQLPAHELEFDADQAPYHHTMAQASRKLKAYNRGGYELNSVLYFT